MVRRFKSPSHVLFHYFKKHKALLAINILISALLSVAMFFAPFFTELLLEKAISNSSSEFYLLIGIIIAIAISRIIMVFLLSAMSRILGLKIELEMRDDAIRKTFSLKQKHFDKVSPGSFISKLVNDPTKIYYYAFIIVSDVIITIGGIIGALIFAFMRSWLIGVVIIAIYIVGIIFSLWIGSRNTRNVLEWKKMYSSINAQVADQVDAITEIKSYNSTKHEIRRQKKNANKLRKSKIKSIRIISSFHAGTSAIVLLSGAIVMSVAGIMLYQGNISLPEFSGFIALTGTLGMPISRFSGLITNYSDGSSSLRRFKNFMELEEEKYVEERFVPKEGEIEFRNVSFHYVKDGKRIYVLRNFNLKINAGQKIALVGESGIGKSTILKLIMGYYKIQSGQILIDGQDIEKVNIGSVRENISYIQQTGVVFDDSVYNNIMYSNTEANSEDIEKIVDESELRDMVNNLENGINETVGRNGSQISGGQRQRITIARAMLANNNIILMDEATSALDNITELKIQRTVDKLFDKKTSVTVAHRISTIENSDVIYLIGKGGKILEQGTYKDLMAKKGDFYKLEQKIEVQ